jgi:acetolactate synthase I/II/III large subunit
MRVADYISSFLIKKGINDIFMLTGYGAMYLNDAIKISGINYYATRNEATAPIMAASYAKIKKKVGVVCVTAGPGSTNAIPGLAEAYVDSAPVIIISGQVDYKHTTFSTKSKKIRSFGTAEINIVPIAKTLSKYSTILKTPNDVKFVLEKAFYIASSGRPGPVWIDIPLDIQKSIIQINKLKKFKPTKKIIKIQNSQNSINKIITMFKKSSKPILLLGNGAKQSQIVGKLKKFIDTIKIPVLSTRYANDLFSHENKYIMGLGGIKGSKYCKEIMNQCDLVLSLGCRFAPQFVGHDFSAFKGAKVISIDLEKEELDKKGQKIDLKLNYDLNDFFPRLANRVKDLSSVKYEKWTSYCENIKKNNPIIDKKIKKNPIDLYYFMERLGELSSKKDILVTDAGSNYYIGGQVWKFKKEQKEICSISNAAMGLTVPLAIGAAVASPNTNILAVTGDGSLELNIQELKTISHNKFNIKLFVINNGGYVSMHNWADTFFKGRRLDTAENTGDGTLNLKNIAKAFDMEHYIIKDYKNVEKSLKHILSLKKPLFVEVVTDNKQLIFDAFQDH